jgi:hypothetical protein
VSFEIKNENFSLMTKELLTNLGYKVIKEQHHIENNENLIGLCVEFKSDIFLKPQYSPNSFTFIDCKVEQLSGDIFIKNLNSLIDAANASKNYTERIGGPISGGIFVYNGSGEHIPQEMVDLGKSHKIFCWDIHRIFFYTMKVFSHSILENWVSQSKLGFVLNEQRIPEQFESDIYETTKFVGIRYSELTENLEIYFSYFCDCKKDPKETTLGINSLHKEHVEKILDDVYETLSSNNMKRFYPLSQKDVTVEIHSLSGFTSDAENGAKLYAPHYKDWKSLGVDKLKIDEHTMFKYSVIPWEAVMDYAFTKRTRKHTLAQTEISDKLFSIESKFAEEISGGVDDEDVIEQFTNKPFKILKPMPCLGYTPLLHADSTRIPIKQRILLFSATRLQSPRRETVDKIIEELKKDVHYNYTWIGILSGSGFSKRNLEFAEKFNYPGFAVGLIDAVTKKLYVNRNTEEGKNFDQMLLSECVR